MSPNEAELRIGFIGAGRLGKALAWSLAAAGLRITQVTSTGGQQAKALAARIPRCEAVADPQCVVDGCDLVFIATPDAAIEAAAAALRWRAGMGVVHCSGVTEVEALRAAADQGAWIGGFHPMQTIGDPLAAVASLPGSTIIIEAVEPLNGWLVALATRLECRVNRLPPGMCGRYHAAAGFTSQFINALFAQAARIWESWGASEEDALRALADFLAASAHSPLRRYTPAGADIDSVIDFRGVFQQAHRGIHRELGALVIVRPDQHVANVLPLGAHEALAAVFMSFLIDRH